MIYLSISSGSSSMPLSLNSEIELSSLNLYWGGEGLVASFTAHMPLLLLLAVVIHISEFFSSGPISKSIG